MMYPTFLLKRKIFAISKIHFGYLDMRLGTQVVDFCGFGGVDDVNQAVAIDQVPVMQNHLPLKYFFDFHTHCLSQTNILTSL